MTLVGINEVALRTGIPRREISQWRLKHREVKPRAANSVGSPLFDVRDFGELLWEVGT